MADRVSKVEQTIVERTFMSNLLTPYLTTSFTLTNQRLITKRPNTILSVIPVGKDESTYFLEQIVSVRTSSRLRGKTLFAGLLVLLFGMGPGFLQILFQLVGLFLLLNCYTSEFIMTNSGGKETGVQVSIIEKKKLKQFAQTVNESLIET